MNYIPFLPFLISIIFFQSSLLAKPHTNIFDVKAYGATGQKEDVATQAIQKAIDACHDLGGGTVYFPPGEYTSGTLVVKSNVTLHLEAGTTLFASRDTLDYEVPFNIYKHNNPNQEVLIYAENAQNIGIRGKGRIHGQAERIYEDLRQVDGFIRRETENARKAGVEMKRYYKVKPYVSLVYLVSCEDVRIEDVAILESSDWTLHVQWCKRVFIKGCYIQSSLEAGVNADGIDVDGSQNVSISDCIIRTGDDAIVMKSTLTNNRSEACENITITNCVLTSTSSALKIGTETYSDFQHIVVNNCVIRDSNRGIGIIVRDGATVSDVIFSNITMDCNRKHFNWWGNADPIWLAVLKRTPASKLGIIQDILFENIIATAQGTSKIEGTSEKNLKNIRLSNVQLHLEAEDQPDKRASYGLYAHHVDNLQLLNLQITWSEDQTEPRWQSALLLDQITALEINSFHGRQGLLSSGLPVIQLRNIQQAYIHNTQPRGGAHLLFQVSGRNTRDISLFNNDVGSIARQKIAFSREVPIEEILIKD